MINTVCNPDASIESAQRVHVYASAPFDRDDSPMQSGGNIPVANNIKIWGQMSSI